MPFLSEMTPNIIYFIGWILSKTFSSNMSWFKHSVHSSAELFSCVQGLQCSSYYVDCLLYSPSSSNLAVNLARAWFLVEINEGRKDIKILVIIILSASTLVIAVVMSFETCCSKCRLIPLLCSYSVNNFSHFL